jgi:hypothetical protein
MTQDEERDYLRPVTGKDVWASWIVGLVVLSALGLIVAM